MMSHNTAEKFTDSQCTAVVSTWSLQAFISVVHRLLLRRPQLCSLVPLTLLAPDVRERENYAEKGGNPFLHMLREWTLT